MSFQEDRGSLVAVWNNCCEKQDPKSIECDGLQFANHSAAFVLATVPPKGTPGERTASKSNGG